MTSNDAGSPKALPWKAAIGVFVLAALAIAAVAFDAKSLLAGFLESLGRLGFWGPALFIALYVAATVLMVPGSVLTLGAGALFGVAWGSLYASAGATLGATAAFLVGRYLARDWVAAKIEGHERFDALDRAVQRAGWKIVALTRLSPVFPFNLLNYAFGLTGVPLGPYILASWIGMIPGTVLYVYLGSLAKAAALPEGRSTGQWLFYGLGLLATIAVTLHVTKLARRALAERAHLPDKPAGAAPPVGFARFPKRFLIVLIF